MKTSSFFSGLVGDIGGTNARFALLTGDGQPLAHVRTLPTADYADLAEALRAYLHEGGVAVPARACTARLAAAFTATAAAPVPMATCGSRMPTT